MTTGTTDLRHGTPDFKVEERLLLCRGMRVERRDHQRFINLPRIGVSDAPSIACDEFNFYSIWIFHKQRVILRAAIRKRIFLIVEAANVILDAVTS